jgi:hypothetical protein
MRKLIVFTALTALICVPAAFAKERNLTLVGKPSVTKAGKAWTATVSVTIDKEPQAGKAPTIRLINQSISTAARVVNISARPTSELGVYRARVAFPTAGTWRVVVIDRMTGRAYSFGRTAVRS